jgi:hypothetical protein
MIEVVSRFAQQVESKLAQLKRHSVEQIARVSYGDGSWPILCVRPTRWEATRPTVLISGGVHDELEQVVELSLTVGKKREGGIDTGRFIPWFFRASTLAVSTQARSRLSRAPI